MPASSASHTPSGNRPATRAPVSSASRVFPVPPVPVKRDQPRLPEQPVQPGQVLLAAQETGQRRGQVMPRGCWRRQNLLPQHRLLQPAQSSPGSSPSSSASMSRARR